ncbi:MAG: SDR family NAD(P)-dependent oxidoreductase [Pseudomonadales bacterium]
MGQGEFDLYNKHVVITGGSSGIGFALAKVLGGRGCKILIAEPSEDRLKTAVDALGGLEVDAAYKTCDVTCLSQVEQLADYAWDTFGCVDMVFNNAGISIPQVPIVDTSLDDLHAVFDVNFFGVWHGCRVFGRRLVEQGTPAGIYNTGSENSLFNAVPNNAGYLASKHAVLGLTDNLREQMPDFIHVGIIIPGFVKSEMTARVGDLAMDTDKFASIVLQQIGDGRFYIVSHAYNMVHIQQRYNEITRAYETYAPRYQGDEEFDVRHLLSTLG